MERFVGVDWGSTGWICAIYDQANWDIEYHPSFLSVWHNHDDADSILVDIPIGLVQEGFRTCDELAKDELGKRQQSVFYTPPRPIFDCRSYPEAASEFEELTGRGMTTQTWSIMPRVRELDEFIAEFPEAHGGHAGSSNGVRESHPEICFAHLGQDEETVSKLEDGGLDHRLSILEEHCSGVTDSYETLVAQHIDELDAYERRFSTNHRDDIVDAMGLAVTALVADGEFETLPKNPPTDSVREVPVEIVYSEPS